MRGRQRLSVELPRKWLRIPGLEPCPQHELSKQSWKEQLHEQKLKGRDRSLHSSYLITGMMGKAL